MFQIPDSIVKLGKERIEGRPVVGFVVGGGKQKPELLLIGEAPGEFEVIHGKPFIGRAGDELLKSLSSIGLTREDVYMTSAVRSRPYRWGTKKARDGSLTERKYNRPPTQEEIIAHAPVLDCEIAKIEAKLIVTLGKIGLQRLLGKDKKISDLHGQVINSPIQYLADLQDKNFSWTDKEYTIIPTFHPASVFYRPSHWPSIEVDWLKIKDFLMKMKQ